LAAIWGHLCVVELLFNHGADIIAQSDDSLTMNRTVFLFTLPQKKDTWILLNSCIILELTLTPRTGSSVTCLWIYSPSLFIYKRSFTCCGIFIESKS